MAISKCPKCEGTDFEMVENLPKGSGYKLYFIQCRRCNTVVGVQEYFNTGYWVQKIAEKLGIDIN